MATILLSAAGAAAGAAFGPLGVAAGRALGASVGYLIDQSLIRATQPDTKGPRLGDVDLTTSTEGRALGRVYGRARLSGQIIWATRYVEVAETSDTGGKGGPSTTNYRYYANFAVGLCEGPISHVGRVFADGVELDTTAVTMRVHLGHDDQPADSLILAKQTLGAPAYRGTAYAVFEMFALEPYGNRIPQLAFEVIRAVDTLEAKLSGVALIPGATEYGYGTSETRRIDGAGASVSENRHNLTAETDLLASLDELQALAPNLKRVALTVAWFGTDLAAGQCRILPGAEHRDKVTDTAWSVAGLDLMTAHLVSRVDGKPAYGGTPSDATVLAAIAELKGRGLEVLLYPLILMDIPPDNAAGQPAYPWRGRIVPGSDVAGDIAAFVGTAVSDGFRRFVLHYAHVAAEGGAEALLLGSELVGLTTARAAGGYPFVTALTALAAEARAIVGPSCKLSYGADWSEYFGHQPADGSGDVAFHLDPFWASDDVDFIGVDFYLPLSDWRHGPHLDELVADTGDDPAYLAAGLTSGEYFDWYYGDDADRRAQTRRPITDGAYGKPWVFRPKDLAGWWSHLHYDRPGGVEAASPTAWRPGMKPIRLTEVGCPAVDLGATRPNAFPDALSSEALLPPGSRGARDDLAQRRYLEAVVDDFAGSDMIQAHDVWAWDARPFPAFPQATDVWADGPNWATGHWLNGRLGGASVDGLIRAVLADHGFSDVETVAVGGAVDGFVIDDRMSARAALEPLMAAFAIDALDTGTALRFAGRQRRVARTLAGDDLVDGDTVVEVTRGEAAALPISVALTTSDALADYRRVTVDARLGDGDDGRAASADLALVLPVAVAAARAEIWLRDARSARETLRFGLGPAQLGLEPGDIVRLPFGDATKTVLIERIEDGTARRVEARGHDPDLYTPLDGGRRGGGAPAVVILDIARATATAPERPLIAATQTPWPGSLAVYRRTTGGGLTPLLTLTRRAVTGRLLTGLAPRPADLWDRGPVLDVAVDAGTLSALPRAAVLAGGNAAAVEREDGGFEVIQFADAALIGDGVWRLTMLLRAQRGSQDDGPRPVPAGGRFVLLDDAVVPLPVGLGDLGQSVTFVVGPSRGLIGTAAFTEVTATIGGRGLTPFAPVHLTATRDSATGDLTFRWHRRSRADGAENWALADAPLDDVPERYRVEVRDSGAAKRIVTVDAAIWTYAAAAQTADFGAPVAACTVSVAQVSPLVGPGFARIATPTPAIT
jgi:hypothetical protein